MKSRRQRNLTSTIELLNQSSYQRSVQTKIENDYFDNFLKSLEDINDYLEDKLEENATNIPIEFTYCELNSRAHNKKNKRYFTQPIVLHEESRGHESNQQK